MDEFVVTVMIAGRPYRLTIAKRDEELVRNATKLIETKMKDYANDYAFKDQQDLLAMVALQHATATITYEEAADFRDNQLATKLVEFDHLLTETLHYR
ncbi:MAG: cell division protein ZapA [Bacteroidales bacterium]|nr:cell division protein ZapA [Bacteroidales bacterium]MDZ4204027.1 cell division protein ZapA [Bacteroidales bacterium]